MNQLCILAGQEFASSGDVRAYGASPFENEDVLSRLVFVREARLGGVPRAAGRVVVLSELGWLGGGRTAPDTH